MLWNPSRDMTTLTPREPYSQEEINKLYPKELKLQLVQVVRADLSLSERHPLERLPANLCSVFATWYGVTLFGRNLTQIERLTLTFQASAHRYLHGLRVYVPDLYS